MNFLPSDPIPGISLVPGQVINYMGQIHDFLFLAWSVPLELSTETAGYSSKESDWTIDMAYQRDNSGFMDLICLQIRQNGKFRNTLMILLIITYKNHRVAIEQSVLH
jgi:hypothetical protein